MNVPNLDAMWEDDLWAFWQRYQHAQKRKDARELVGARKGYTILAAKLGAYACNKAVAMKCRRDGRVETAQIYEKICDNIYAQLPEDLRW